MQKRRLQTLQGFQPGSHARLDLETTVDGPRGVSEAYRGNGLFGTGEGIASRLKAAGEGKSRKLSDPETGFGMRLERAADRLSAIRNVSASAGRATFL
jgi:hypothetical protein